MSKKQQVAGPQYPRTSPLYINSNCPKCKEKLVQEDLFYNSKCPPEEIWYDEWMCPKCQDRSYMDWPDWYAKQCWSGSGSSDVTLVDGEGK